MAALEARLRGGSEQLRRCLLETPADQMKAVTQSHPLTRCGAGSKDAAEADGACEEGLVLLPSLSKGILLISMSRNLALGGNFVPQEQQ